LYAQYQSYGWLTYLNQAFIGLIAPQIFASFPAVSQLKSTEFELSVRSNNIKIPHRKSFYGNPPCVRVLVVKMQLHGRKIL